MAEYSGDLANMNEWQMISDDHTYAQTGKRTKEGEEDKELARRGEKKRSS